MQSSKRNPRSKPEKGTQKQGEDKKSPMPKTLKSALFVLTGAAIALILLGFYSWVIDPYENYGQPEELPPVKVSGKDVFITGISGEVYIIRYERIITAGVGDILKEGDVIKVVDQSYCQIQFSDRGTAGIDSNTVMLMKKLVNAQKDMQIRTEVLMGSMLYSVKKLTENDQFEVESDGILYDVKGTEFLVVNSSAGTLLAVEEGAVHFTVDGEERAVPLVKTGEEVFIDKEDRTQADVYPMGESASTRIENMTGIGQLNVEMGSWPVTVAIETSPGGADIYLDGTRIARGLFTGLFDVGSELNFLVRKRGYLDKSLHLTIKNGEDKIYLIELDPAGLDATMEEDEGGESFEGILNRMRLSHEKEINEQKSYFDRELNQQLSTISQLSDDKESLEVKNNDLQSQVNAQEQQVEELKRLMIQIQELSNQE
jgi:hypothetical protein